MNKKTLHVLYFAILREQRGCDKETLQSEAQTPRELYEELRIHHYFGLSPNMLKVAVNNEFQNWETPLKSGDTIIFIPPVAGG